VSFARRVTSRIKNKKFFSLKTVLLSFVLLVGIGGVITPVFADNTYSAYNNLFTSGPAPAGKQYGFFSRYAGNQVVSHNGASITALNFLFNWGFDLNSIGTVGKAWDHVTDFSDYKNIFLVRVCDLDSNGNSINTSCAFGPVPYTSFDIESCLTNERASALNGVTTACTGEFGLSKILSHSTVLKRTGSASNGYDLDPKKGDYTTKGGVFIALDSLKSIGATGELSTNVPLSSKFAIGSPTQYQADFWYCGYNHGDNSDPVPADSTAIAGNDDVNFFGKLCGGHPYFKVGDTVKFGIPAAATTPSPTAADENSVVKTQIEQNQDVLPVCAVIGTGSFMGCLAKLAFYLIFRPIAWFASLMGQLFDFFIGYSVSDESYRAEFAIRGWRIVRDFSNIFFIIIMVYTGFATVFNSSTVSLKKVVPALILNAILINFSLFGTRVVIDLSNVTARIFYSRIKVCERSDCKPVDMNNNPDPAGQVHYKRGIAGYWPLSEKIVSAFNPQAIMKPALLKATQGAPTSGNKEDIDFSTQDKASGLSVNDSTYAGYFIVVSLIGAAIMLAVAIMFWKVAFIFLGRVIGLYMAMIFAPFAVLSRGNVPLVSSIKELSWSSWVKEITSYAVLAPLFLFFLYVIYFFLQSDFMSAYGIAKSDSFFETVLYIAIPMLIIYTLITQGANLAKTYSGKFGGMVQGWVDKTVGGVGGIVGGGVGLAAGGAALLGTRFGSRLGKMVGTSAAGKWAGENSENSRVARGLNNALNWTQNSSWDFRKTKLNQKIGSGLGMMGEKMQDKLTPALATLPVGNLTNFTEKRFEGGYKGQQKRRQAEITKSFEERFKFDYLSDAQSKQLWERRQNKKAGEQAVEEYAKSKSTEYKAAHDTIESEKAQLKTTVAEIKTIQNKLATEKSTLTATEKSSLEQDLKNKQKAADDSNSKIGKANQEKAAALATVKTQKYKDDPTYAGILATAIDDQKKDDKKKYGDISTTKAYANAMRHDYVENMKNNSIWMKDGKQRSWLMGAGAGYGAASGLAGSTLGGFGLTAAGFVTSAATTIMAERLKFEQEALESAANKYTKDYGKRRGKNRTDQLEEQLKEIDEAIDNHVSEHLAEKAAGIGRTATDDQKQAAKDEMKNMNAEQKMKTMKERAARLKEELSVKEEQYKAAADDFRRDPTKEGAFRDAARAKTAAEDGYNEAKNAYERRDKKQSDIDKEKEKADAKKAKEEAK
jgi:hypothetical protein